MKLLFHPFRRRQYLDITLIIFILAFTCGLAQPIQQRICFHKTGVVDISLSPWLLPKYTFITMMRGVIGYAISLVFAITYAFWAAKDERAGKLLLPLLDILQSLPVLSFMPGLVITLSLLFRQSNFGLELAAIIMIVTGQVWNMTLSLHSSFKSIPSDLQEVGTIYKFNWWERLKWIELPCGATGLVWNSMMSMAGGWFFITITERFPLKEIKFCLPGLGSYLGLAEENNDKQAMIFGMIAMIAMIVILDQIIWRPVTVWAQRFQIDDISNPNPPTSWLLKLLRHSYIIRWIKAQLVRRRHIKNQQIFKTSLEQTQKIQQYIANLALCTLCTIAILAIATIFKYLGCLPQKIDWIVLMQAGGKTLLRVISTVVIGTALALPTGLAIGLSTRLSKFFQPIIQIAASFPAPLLFPLISVILFQYCSYNYRCIILMLASTQWYILFNVIAGTMAIPNDLKEVTTSFHFSRWQKLKSLYLPAIFPYLLTGWVTASGGAWNASILAEHYKKDTQVSIPSGLGSIIYDATIKGEYAQLLASALLMSAIVIIFNNTVWRQCYALAHKHYSMDK